ncbi:MAG TPA: hypothetical protein VN880_01880 [Solirubrobacteraceae bacterium]|nr:hypothetical protein [Solirubrobacteraceae bacterium]
MTDAPPSQLRVLAFGDLDGEIWGCAVDAGDPAIVFTTPDGNGSATGAGTISLNDDRSAWTVTGDGFELRATPVAHDGPDGAAAGELCRVQGTLTVAGARREVECLGTRSEGDPSRVKRLRSARAISSWFASDRGLALLALRPDSGKGHESDLIDAIVFEPDGWIAVDEPRLSTTFRAGDQPARASLELWITEGDEQYPRRAAAEASGPGAAVDGVGISLHVTPLRCHTGGLDGAGIYLLARF